MEVKLLAQLAEGNRAWRPLHSLVLGLLMAHRHPQTGLIRPSRQSLAASCGVSADTLDRALRQLQGWRLIQWQRGGILPRGLRAANRYELLFELPRIGRVTDGASRVAPSAANGLPPSAANPVSPSAANGLPPSAAQLCGTKQYLEAKTLEAKNLEALAKFWQKVLEIADQELESDLRAEMENRGISDESYWQVVDYGFHEAFDDSAIREVSGGQFFLDGPERVALIHGLYRYEEFLLDALAEVGFKKIELQPMYVLDEVGVGARQLNPLLRASYASQDR